MAPFLCGFLGIDQVLCCDSVVGGFLNQSAHLDRTDSPSIDHGNEGVGLDAADGCRVLEGHGLQAYPVMK